MVKNNVQVDLEHDMEVEETPKPFKAYNFFGKLKKSANYNYLYEREYKRYLKSIKKANKKKK